MYYSLSHLTLNSGLACFEGLMEDENLMARLATMNKNVLRSLDSKAKDYETKKLVPLTFKDVQEIFEEHYIIEDGDPTYSRNSLQAYLDNGDFARFNVPNDVLHLRRKADNKEVLEIVANGAQVNLV